MKTMPEARIVFLCRDSQASATRSGAAIRSMLGPELGTRPLRLTAREQEVLALLCEGLSNKHICRRLNIAAGTVKCHIASILGTLGVASRLQAVVEAQRLGLVAAPRARAPQQHTGSDGDDESDDDGDAGMGLATAPRHAIRAMA